LDDLAQVLRADRPVEQAVLRVQVQVGEVRAPSVDVAVGSHGRRLTTPRAALARLALGFTLACVACSRPADSASGNGAAEPAVAARGGPVHLTLETAFHSLDPADARDPVGRRLTSLIF